MYPAAGMVWLDASTQRNQSSIQEVPVSAINYDIFALSILICIVTVQIKIFPPRRWWHSSYGLLYPLKREATFPKHLILTNSKKTISTPTAVRRPEFLTTLLRFT